MFPVQCISIDSTIHFQVMFNRIVSLCSIIFLINFLTRLNNPSSVYHYLLTHNLNTIEHLSDICHHMIIDWPHAYICETWGKHNNGNKLRTSCLHNDQYLDTSYHAKNCWHPEAWTKRPTLCRHFLVNFSNENCHLLLIRVVFFFVMKEGPF